MAQANSNELSQWVQDYTDDMYRWALHKVSNAELAEDLVQDVFLAAAEKLDSFKGNSSPKTWLFSILNFKIIDVYRKKTKQTVEAESDFLQNFFSENGSWNAEAQPQNWDNADEHLLDNIDFQNVLAACLDNLPEKWRACVELKYLTDKSGEEICQEVDVTSTNFWQIVHRAKLKLRACVEQNWFKD